MVTISTVGFLDALANKIVTLPGITLVKGTDLFAGRVYDNPDELKDIVALMDEGYTELQFRHRHMNWDVRIATTRQDRIASLDSLRVLVSALLKIRNVQIRSDTSEDYKLLTGRIVASPVVTRKTDSGRYLVESIVQFQVIPF